jgi:arylsulfatase A-like enzyme
MEGVSMLYSFEDANAAERHQTEYFQIFGNRGIYHQGWSAITKHRTPWQTVGEVSILPVPLRCGLRSGSTPDGHGT